MFVEKKQNLFRYETIGLVGLREYKKTCKAALPSFRESYLLVNPKIYGG